MLIDKIPEAVAKINICLRNIAEVERYICPDTQKKRPYAEAVVLAQNPAVLEDLVLFICQQARKYQELVSIKTLYYSGEDRYHFIIGCNNLEDIKEFLSHICPIVHDYGQKYRTRLKKRKPKL